VRFRINEKTKAEQYASMLKPFVVYHLHKSPTSPSTTKVISSVSDANHLANASRFLFIFQSHDFLSAIPPLFFCHIERILA
jgi:hypothetical protein